MKFTPFYCCYHLYYDYNTFLFFYFLTSATSVISQRQNNVRIPLIQYDNGVERVQELTRFLQPDDLLSGKYDYTRPTDYQCARNCDLYPESRLCYYKFVLEQYHVMGPACDGCPQDPNACNRTHCVPADGIEKTILTVNRRLCSPAIMVCYGDRVVIDVINKMPARTNSIHGHGIHFRGYPWMDGASYVTQCPILEGQTFRYEYPMEQVGDFFYHSHDGIQMTDGLQGPLISRSSKLWDPHADEYDEDLYSHTIFIQDWMHFLTDDKIPGYNRVRSKTAFQPESFLINGHGSFRTADGIETNTPYAVFNVVRGRRYRFRIISSVNPASIFTVEDHDFRLITMDAYPIRTVRGSSLFLTSGERYSIVITANQEPRSYWIQIRALLLDVVQYAILRYVNADGTDVVNSTLIPRTRRPLRYTTPILNDVTGGCDPANTTAICIDQFEALSPAPYVLLKPEPDFRLFLIPSFHYFIPEELYNEGRYFKHYLPSAGPSLGGGMYSDTYNNVTMSLPPFSMLTQNDPFPRHSICTAECFRLDSFCECAPLYKIPLGAVVEIVLVDATYDGLLYHSHHLHGYSFRVLKMGSAEEIRRNPNFYKNIIPTGYELFPLKDSMTVPFNGYAVIRFWATNPGVWLFHCHVSSHAQMGMSVILQTGEKQQFPNPPEGFPRCGNFIPDVRLP